MLLILQGIFEILTQTAWGQIAAAVTALLGGGGIYKILQVIFNHKREIKEANKEAGSDLRDELRKELQAVRERLDQAENEIQKWREKHFELQEKYYELKRDYDSAKAQNEKLRGEVEKLRVEVDEYRNG